MSRALTKIDFFHSPEAAKTIQAKYVQIAHIFGRKQYNSAGSTTALRTEVAGLTIAKVQRLQALTEILETLQVCATSKADSSRPSQLNFVDILQYG